MTIVLIVCDRLKPNLFDEGHMQEGISPTDQLQLATLVFPVVALVVNFAINSVEEGDGWKYRWFVGGSGLFAIAPAFVVLFLGLQGYRQSQVIDEIFRHLMVTFTAVMVLTIGVIIVEIYRGLEDREKGSYHLAFGLLLIVVLLWAVMRLI